MPIEIIEKRKTELQCPGQHTSLVPLRVIAHKEHYGTNNDPTEVVRIGDIVVNLPNRRGSYSLFNATQGELIDSRYNDYILCRRAYEIERIVICNDATPAPIV